MYYRYLTVLTPLQKSKLQRAIRTKSALTLEIDPKKKGKDVLNLTKRQIIKLKKSQSPVRIHISKTQLGGFLPFLVPALITLGKAAALGAASYAGSKIAQKIDGKGLYIPGKQQKGYGCKKKTKEGPLSNHDILRYMHQEKNFRGVFSIDELPKRLHENETGIVNFDKSTDPGSHWVAYVNDSRSCFTEYFDPFGLSPPKEIAKYLSVKPILFNSSQLQSDVSKNCGHFCIYYIKMRNRGVSPYDVLYSFTQQPSTENELKVR